ncbi:MAG: hypothetical protein K2O10_01480, partial [Muribaculaceae bacterium]|nr:hypothetical protein [Muribaculaceae bacterium]
AMQMAHEIFGRDAFRKTIGGKRGPINKALFEVVSVTFAQLSPDDRRQLVMSHGDELAGSLKALMSDNQKFYYAISTTTGREDNVKNRFSAFVGMVDLILDKKNDKNA